jgi:hypothetical protein
MENSQKIKTHEDLRVYQTAFDAAIKIFLSPIKFVAPPDLSVLILPKLGENAVTKPLLLPN